MLGGLNSLYRHCDGEKLLNVVINISGVVVCFRYAITVWYFDSEERAEAKRRFKDLTGTNTQRTQL